MKSQTDLIITIVAGVVALIVAGVCYGTKPQPQPLTAVAPVDVKPAVMPEGDVKMGTALPSGGPGGGGNPGGGLSGAPGGRGGGKMNGGPSAEGR